MIPALQMDFLHLGIIFYPSKMNQEHPKYQNELLTTRKMNYCMISSEFGI